MVLINFITGRIGSGKSTVAKALREMGFPVLNTDTIFMDLIRNDPIIRGVLYAKFGVSATNDAGELNDAITEKYVNDLATYEWVWDHLASRMIDVIQNINGCLLGYPVSFIEVPVIYPWLRRWLSHCGMTKQPPAMMTVEHTVITGQVREFRIAVSDDNERFERRVSEFVKKEDLYLGEYSSAADLLFHSRSEIDRNKKIVEAYRGVIKTLDERQKTYEDAIDIDPIVKYDTKTYLNDTPDSPVEIARMIAEEVRK
ncbi:MAG: dephospho-CoA kinase [Fibrobacter sp.]|nr:dephospho-CoA kinase [Fibrobacter sp.]